MNEITKLLFLILVISFLPGYSSVNVKQDKGLLIVQSGGLAVLTCAQDDSSYYYMYWYQHKAGQALKLMVLSIEVGSEDMEGDFKSKWYLKRPSVFSSTLHLNRSEIEDSATYFCASSPGQGVNTGAKLEFGGGTILSILGEKEKQIEPKVRLFPPDKQEFKEHSLLSLVCVASGFFPEHVRLTWYLNNEKIESLYQNVPKRDENNTYSTSSRLSLTESQYFNPDTKIRCEAAFVGSNITASDETHGELGCGVSKESYGMYMNQGKISYIMVLFKSGLYALIVMAVIWRRKALSGSC